MNLINDPWIPIRRKSNLPELITPWQLTETEDPVIALNAPRPDFNGALMQFLIGLLQTVAMPENSNQWLTWLEEPPTLEKLKERCGQYAYAFELRGIQGAFMQDFSALDIDSKSEPIQQLLIDSPGKNTISENKDHFVHRGKVRYLCPGCAATALFTLQINAPSGGAGHRTSLRGGGPLTTLVIQDKNNDLPDTLWRTLWLNVIEQSAFKKLGNINKTDDNDIFPWLAETRISEKNTGQTTTPMDVNPLQMYWSMPRRVRLNWDSNLTGDCDLCETRNTVLVADYKTKNYGINYEGAYQHPLSPHRVEKKGLLLPQHAQPGGVTYLHWLSLVEDDENQVSAYVAKRYRNKAEDWEEQFRLYAFGYDMDNMKARCWYETTLPLYTIDEKIRNDFSKRVQRLTETASKFANKVRFCVKKAWFDRPGKTKGDTAFLTQSFYQHTESAFFQAVKSLQTHLSKGTDKEVLHGWHTSLCKAAYYLFDYWASRGDIVQANPRRIAEAREELNKFIYSKAVRQNLQLPDKPIEESI